ncbi:PREDICTED: transcription factor E2FB-like [Prunus mume]|uniref:Transcription factor E2FB-like n=1 Tax=Prunus mume TaxID=102107 RepID=A0ABM1LHW2_PRUMU|nr:PREDICTED: transcription factor E2FB-like [Prunus mume]
MPELLWKAYIDFELSEGEFERARELYERLLDRTKHLKLKRKSDAADYEAESSDRTAATGYTEAVTSPLQTPVSSKVGRANKTSRLTKCSRSGPQTPASNVGSPSGANLTPAGPCRFDSSLGLLTKKFINLIKHAEDGILDLNNAADTLEAQVENLSDEERRLDQQIREMQERLRDLSEDESNKK